MNIRDFFNDNSLGNVKVISKLTGGLMHKMFKVETDKGIYAIKILNPEVMNRETAYNNFIISEIISNFVKENGIEVSSAIKIGNTYVSKYRDNYYMVFDYVDGRTINDEEISIDHCRKIGSILGKIHGLDYKSLGLVEEKEEINYYVEWESFIKNGNFSNMKYRNLYLCNYKKYYSILKRVVKRLNDTSKELVICHRDMDPKNVMWQGYEPIIIDWEAASLANPYEELIEVALCWSGFLSANFDENKFVAVIEEYVKIKPFEHKRYNIICGNLIGRFEWLEYNLKRSLGICSNDEEEMKLAENEVGKTIDEINRYLELIGKMYKIICNLTKKNNDDKNNNNIKKIINENEILRGKEYSFISTGFTNTIYQVEDYIVRICTDLNNEERFKNEINFYLRNRDNKTVPKMYLYNISKDEVPYYYEVVERLNGKTLYQVWYKLSTEERKKIVLEIIEVLKSFHIVEGNAYNFSEFLSKKIEGIFEECNLSMDDFLGINDLCNFYFNENKFVLLHGDLHFDNCIYNDGKIRLIDFERCMFGPVDYEFRLFDRYDDEPWKWASSDTDMLTVEDDYRGFMDMFIDGYDELRNISFLQERLVVYNFIELLKDYRNTRDVSLIELLKERYDDMMGKYEDNKLLMLKKNYNKIGGKV